MQRQHAFSQARQWLYLQNSALKYGRIIFYGCNLFYSPRTLPHASTHHLLFAHSRKVARDVCTYASREYCVAKLETEVAKENPFCQRGSS